MSSDEDIEIVEGGPSLGPAADSAAVDAGDSADMDVGRPAGGRDEEGDMREQDVDVGDAFDLTNDEEEEDGDSDVIVGDDQPPAAAGVAARDAALASSQPDAEPQDAPAPEQQPQGALLPRAEPVTVASSAAQQRSALGERKRGVRGPGVDGGGALPNGESLSSIAAAEAQRAAAAAAAESAPCAGAERKSPPAASSSGGDSSSDDDEEDDAPLSARQNGHGAGGKKKRRQLLPAMKKACITVREAQMRELEKKGDLPVVLLPQLGSRGSGSSGGGAPALPAASSSGSIARKAQQQRKYSALEEGEAAPAKPRRKPDLELEPERDPFVAALNPIIDRSGGVSSLSHGKRLVALLDLARNAAQRLVVLTVLDKSSGAVQAGFAHSPGLARLGEWLGGAQAGEGASVKLAGRLLDVLGALPIDTAALQGSGIGKLIGKLHKRGPPQLRERAKALMDAWIAAVERERVAPKRAMPAAGAAADGPAAKRPKTEGSAPAANGAVVTQQQQTGGKAAHATPGASLSMLAATDLDMPEVVAPAPKLQPAAAAAAASEAAAGAPGPAKPHGVTRDAAQPHKVKLLDAEAMQKLAQERSSSEADRPAASPRGHASAPTHSAQPSSAAAAPSAAPAAPGAAAPAAGSAAEASTGNRGGPAGTSLAAPRTTSIGGGATTRITNFSTSSIGGGLGVSSSGLGGPRPLLPHALDAHARAAVAARSVPSPPRDAAAARPPKRKKVSWVPEERLVAVRWFRKDEPVASVRSNAALAGQEVGPPLAGAVQSVHPPGFEISARAEHQNEALALRHMSTQRQPASEEEEAEEPEMGAKIGWALPPPAAPPPGYAAGEESGEARVQYVRASLTPPVHYGPGGLAPPENPAEAPHEPAPVGAPRLIRLDIAQAPPLQQQQQLPPPPVQQLPPQQQQQYPQPQQLPPQGQFAPGPAPMPLLPQQQQQQVQPVYAPPAQPQQQPLGAFQNLPPQQLNAVQQILDQLQLPSQATAPPRQQQGLLGPLPQAAGGGPPLLAPPEALHQPGPPIMVPPPGGHRPTEPARQEIGGRSGRGRAGAGRGREGARGGAGLNGPGPKPCAFYNLPQGCRHGDQCRFAHEATGEPQESLRARAAALSKGARLRGDGAGDTLRVQGPSIFNPNAPAEGPLIPQQQQQQPLPPPPPRQRPGAAWHAPGAHGGRGATAPGRRREAEREPERPRAKARERDMQFES